MAKNSETYYSLQIQEDLPSKRYW